MAALDDGLILHPTWGRSPWRYQSVRGLTISTPIADEGGDVLHEAVEDAADGVVRRLT